MAGPEDKTDVDALVDSWLAQDTPETTTETPQENSGEDTVAGTEGADANATPTPEQPTKPDQPAAPASDKERPDKQASKSAPGDLVDREGRVIARAGAERRHYEAATRFRGQLENTTQQLQKVQTELDAFRQAAQLPTQLGLGPDEAATGLQLMASWKQNPVSVIEYLVEQAKAAGHTLDTLGGTTDVGAIKQMIAQELAPFTQQHQQQRAVQEQQTAAQQQVQGLINEYGESALVNSTALSKLIDASIDRGRPLNLEQAYLRFTSWCYQQGFDPQRPIDPQIAARAAPQQPATEQRPPRPNGRAAPNGVIPMDTAAGITGNEGTRDLVRAAMRDAGFNV